MRRQLAAALIVGVLGSSSVSAANDFPYGRSLAFTVYRNGKEIGHHTISFQNEGVNRKVTVVIDLAVKALGVTAYRYVHNSHEVWSGNSLQALEARTDDNGKKYIVRVQRGSNGLVVDREALPQPFASASADQGVYALCESVCGGLEQQLDALHELVRGTGR